MQSNYEFVGTKRDFVLSLPALVNGFGFTTCEYWASKQFNINAAVLTRLVNASKHDRIMFINETEVQMELDLN
jgi:hypothetical protein